ETVDRTRRITLRRARRFRVLAVPCPDGTNCRWKRLWEVAPSFGDLLPFRMKMSAQRLSRGVVVSFEDLVYFAQSKEHDLVVNAITRDDAGALQPVDRVDGLTFNFWSEFSSGQ